MKVLIVCESMFGNTHQIADCIADGLRTVGNVVVVPVAGVEPALVETADLLVVGGPTHVHGMTSARSRQAAIDLGSKHASTLAVDPGARGPGLRDWFENLPDGPGKLAAAFDTRAPGSPLLTGKASRGIAARLRRRQFRVIAHPKSFIVGKDNHLVPGAEERARAWGEHLAATLSETLSSSSSDRARSSGPARSPTAATR